MKTLAERFWSKVDKSGECWLWTGSRFWCGYGSFRVGDKIKYAHRVSWELAHGEIPEGLKVLHKCDNPPCVNPDHLFLGTDSDNSEDCTKKGRRNSRVGSMNPKASLTEENVKSIRKEAEKGVRGLAKKYGVSRFTIWDIVVRRTWKHIKP